MLIKRVFLGVIALGVTFTLALPQYAGLVASASLTPIEQLGKQLFFDQNLSKNGNQSCASCHDPATGFSGDDSGANAGASVYAGSDPALFGNRKPPTAAYLGDSPALAFDEAKGEWVGGMFFDGRATGATMGDPLAEQAKAPFLNPLEMGLSSAEELRDKVKEGAYYALFEQVWGAGALDGEVETVSDQICVSIAAYERSDEVNPYSSKFDRFWDKATAKGFDVAQINSGNWTQYRGLGLSKKELRGLVVFNRPGEGNCSSCHSLAPGSKGYPLFTDFTYTNIGTPRNPQNPFYANLTYNPAGDTWQDLGLGGFLRSEAEIGKVKVPTLRNVDKRPYGNLIKAYGHNGYFKSLPEIVDFYARGAEAGGQFGIPPVPAEVASNQAFIKRFSNLDQDAVVAFLKTLSDGYRTFWFG
jgi:cytochrome c peroxidase